MSHYGWANKKACDVHDIRLEFISAIFDKSKDLKIDLTHRLSQDRITDLVSKWYFSDSDKEVHQVAGNSLEPARLG
jgi:hypothetical protein